MEVNSGNNKDNIQNNTVVLRNNARMSWRPSCIVNVLNDIIRRSNPVLDSVPTAKNNNTVTPPESPDGTSSTNKFKRKDSTKSIKDKSKSNTVINIVLVEAKGLPDVRDDGQPHGIYCKFRLGSHSYKTKTAQNTRHPQWKERLKLSGNGDQLLHVSLWDKGKQKNFMGRKMLSDLRCSKLNQIRDKENRILVLISYELGEEPINCVLDLSTREKERTHDIWQQLDEGYGFIHLSVTICLLKNLDSSVPSPEPKVEDLQSKFAFYNVNTDLKVVGQLHVRVCGAKGLNGKPNAYCTIGLDNEVIQTPQANCTAEPVWDKSYVFNVYDVTSALEVKVHDSSINSFLNDFLGRVTIPLLRIRDGEMHWYALKDIHKRRSAKGNCPRIRLEMSLVWNPVTASLKLFRPKQVKYTAKPPKFDIPLIYKNVKFIQDTFDFLYRINESFKRLFEWEDREIAAIALTLWLVFWYFFEPWMGPVLIVATFPIVYIYDQDQPWEFSRYSTDDEMENTEDTQNGDTITHKVKGLPEMTLTITNGIEYLVSVAERLYNLAAFKVPFLSYLTIVLLLAGSAILYCIPFKCLMMSFGLYKFLRKRIHPDRVLNNDLLDFISRIPDNKILKDWKELSVPEPQFSPILQQAHVKRLEESNHKNRKPLKPHLILVALMTFIDLVIIITVYLVPLTVD